MPAERKKLFFDAQNISELTLGPQLVYHLLVDRCIGPSSDAISQRMWQEEIVEKVKQLNVL
jgi:hypothetical protein